MHDNGKGTADHRKVVPNGTCLIELRMLKALGDRTNAAHWETWVSRPVTIGAGSHAAGPFYFGPLAGHAGSRTAIRVSRQKLPI